MSLVLAVMAGMFVSVASLAMFSALFAARISIERRLSLLTEQNADIKQIEDEELKGSFYERIIKPMIQQFGNLLSRMAPAKLKLRELERLQAAGNPMKLSIYEWLTWRLLSLILGVASGLFLFFQIEHVLIRLSAFVALLLLGIYFPSLILADQIQRRRKKMLKELPDAIDLLSVSVEAGLGFDAAMAKMAEKLKGTVSEEFQKALQEMKMGKSRREALRDLAKRNQLEELHSFIRSVLQADQLGVPLVNVLRIQSEEIKERRKQIAEEQAMKAPVKILFPLILFIFPAIFVIILGPAMINIIRTLMK